MSERWTRIRPPLLRDERSGCVAWITEPLGYLIALEGRERVTVAYADFMMGPVYDAVVARKTHDGQRLLNMADWSAMTSYDEGARKRLTSWMIGNRRKVSRLVTITRPQNTMARMGLAVARTMLALGGLRLEIYYDADEMQRKVDFQLVP